VSFAQTERGRREDDNEEEEHEQRLEELFYRQRAYPLDHIPVGARLRAIRQKERMALERGPSAATRDAAAPLTGKWKFIGPQPASFFGVNSGRVTALAVDPRNGDVVYAGAADGGVWKTKDGGEHWKPISDGQPSLSIGSIALDPSAPDTVYVGTGEANNSGDAYGGLGILKSSNGGATWINTPGPFAGFAISAVSVCPSDRQVILAGSVGGVYRSADGGATWAPVLQGEFASAVAFDPLNGNIAWAGLGNPFFDFSAGIFRSSDGGQTWSAVTGTAPNALPTQNLGRIAIAISPSHTSTVYAGIQDSRNLNSTLGLYRTDDGGANWTTLPSPNYGGGWYCNVLSVSPVNPDVVLGGGCSLGVSTDQGKTWKLFYENYYVERYQPGNVLVHVDQHAVAFSADGHKVYAGNDGGVYSTTDFSNPGANWTDLNATLAITQFYRSPALHPTDPKITLGGTQDNGTLLYDGSLHWTGVACGDGGANAIDFMNPSNMYVACSTGGTLLKSTNAGGDFQLASTGITEAPFDPGLAMDPANPRILYFAGSKHIYQSTNGAGSWQVISPDLTNSNLGYDMLMAIAVAPSDPNAVNVGTFAGRFRTTNNALSGPAARWEDRSAGLPAQTVTQIAIDPANPLLAYVTLSGFGAGHVWETPDGGGTWLDISGNLPDIPANDLALDPDIGGRIYLATDIGVFATTDGGTSWSPLGTGLPGAPVTGLAFHHASRILRVSTHGRGMWDLAIPVPPLGIAAGGIVNAASLGLTSSTSVTNGSVVPGSVVDVFGTSMTTTREAVAAAPPLPTKLGGESLAIAEFDAPQFSALSDKLTVQIPWEVPLGTATAVLSVGSATTSSKVQVVPYLPGIFSADGTGTGQGNIFHGKSKVLAAPLGAAPGSRPAKTGDTLTLSCTGLGAVNNQPRTGAASPSQPIAQTTVPPSVSVGGVPATVISSALTPGEVGMYQVSFVVPTVASWGDSVPVVLSIGGVSSNPVDVALTVPFSTDESNPLAVSLPLSFSGTFTQTNVFDWFSFSLAQPATVQFQLTGIGDFAGTMFVFSNGSTIPDFEVDTPGSGVVDMMLDAGTYLFDIFALNPGSYRVTVAAAP